jgi:MFS family permease
MIYSGTMAGLQIPAARVAERLGGGTVLALGTALCGLCYALVGLGHGFWWLVAVLFVGGFGAATQHPIGSALVTRTFTGAQSLTAFGTYNFAGDVGKVLLPAFAAALLLVMSWQPAYALLGLLGIVAAVPIFLLAPRLMPEQAKAADRDANASDVAERTTTARLGYRILMVFGIADGIIRGSLFVLLPFLLIAKGAAVSTAGVALTLVFLGGAFGKLACAWVARRLGAVATIMTAQALTAAGILAVLVLPLSFALALLPPARRCPERRHDGDLRIGTVLCPARAAHACAERLLYDHDWIGRTGATAERLRRRPARDPARDRCDCGDDARDRPARLWAAGRPTGRTRCVSKANGKSAFS